MFWEAGPLALHMPLHFKATTGKKGKLSTVLAQVSSAQLLGNRACDCAERLPLLTLLPGLLSRTGGWGPSVAPAAH